MSSRYRWKVGVALAALLAVGVVCLLVGKAQERNVFVSRVAPRSGYRCRFTLASDWKRVQMREDDFEMFVISRSPIQQWIGTHLKHRVFDAFPNITISCDQRTAEQVPMAPDGYPDAPNRRDYHLDRCRHLRIDGNPATVSVCSSSIDRVTIMAFYAPEQSVSCWLEITSEIQDSDQADREMQAIIASFHIEKVRGASGVKR